VGEPEAGDGSIDIMDWIAPFACHDYPVGGAPSTNSRRSSDVSQGDAANGLKFTRASDTALEGSLVADSSLAEAASYLQPVEDAGKSAAPWLQAIARQVPRLKTWWRCVASSMSDSTSGTAARRNGLSAMLESAVMSASEEAQAFAVNTLHSWAEDWRDREGHLRKVMHE